MANAFGLVAVDDADAEQAQERQDGVRFRTIGLGTMGLGIGEGNLSFAGLAGHGVAASTVPTPNDASGYPYTRGLAARRSRMTPSPVVVTPPPAPSTSPPNQPPSSTQSSAATGSSGFRSRLTGGFDLSDLRHSLLAVDSIASSSSPNPSATSSHPSPSASPRGFVPRPTRMTTTEALQNILALSSPSHPHFPPSSSVKSAPKPARPFSYKTHFKCAYLTEQAWLRGPGRLLSTQMSADRGIVTSLGYDNEWIVVGMSTSKVHVFEAETGTLCIHTLTGHTSTVRCLRVLDGRPIAVSGSRDGSVRVWDIDKGESVHVLAGHTMSVRAIDICGNRALWNVDTGECLHVFRGHLSQIYSVAFDGLRVITGSLDSTVRVWDAETGKFIALLQGHTSLVGQLHLDPHTGTLVSGGSDGRVIVYSLASYEPLHRINAHKSSVTCLQFDERFIVSGGNDGCIKLWDMRTGAYIRDLAEQSSGIWRVIVRDDKCIVLSRREEPNPIPTAEEPELTVERTLMDVRTFRPSDAELYGRA
ncbi:hypothetical protein Rt10032_c03g1608 [Rhodotorula toruloides]|uniref:Uncharacterized protein n=1 Tax=Rhodotorula toruloides TaxID=5286 RepID=A0A511KB64_RHOTO|nr:hypothetical protein Rt10032_c03g1608 [Rhodotorula toruloides]